jgi:hypothetical protein
MPFKSKAQMRWMFARHPEMAKRWAKETPSLKRLPERATRGLKRAARER